MYSGLTGTYPDAVPLNPRALVPAHSPLVSVSDRGTVRLQQEGNVIYLTPGEVAALAALVHA